VRGVWERSRSATGDVKLTAMSAVYPYEGIKRLHGKARRRPWKVERREVSGPWMMTTTTKRSLPPIRGCAVPLGETLVESITTKTWRWTMRPQPLPRSLDPRQRARAKPVMPRTTTRIYSQLDKSFGFEFKYRPSRKQHLPPGDRPNLQTPTRSRRASRSSFA
jgi:hypothetical protein